MGESVRWWRILPVCLLPILFILFIVSCGSNGTNWNGDQITVIAENVDTSPPAETIKLVFIHHSCGRNWLVDNNGELGKRLNENNYYVTECYYGWDDHPPEAHYDVMGDHTNTEDWPYWFNDVVMPSVYANEEHPNYENRIPNPGGENVIIMFKSCYNNSYVGDSIEDEKEIYNSLLEYFSQHPDKLFILITPPPMIHIQNNELTRELCNWLVSPNGWLRDYELKNVAVFDFYNILTDPNNHHHVEDGRIVHIVSINPVDPEHPNELYYYSGSDNHPTKEGNLKATEEFIPFLNAVYNIWKSGEMHGRE